MTPPQPDTQSEAAQPPTPSEGPLADAGAKLTAEQYQQLLYLQQQQQQQQQLQAQLQQAAQAAATPLQWSAQTHLPLQQKLSLSKEFQTHPLDQVALQLWQQNPPNLQKQVRCSRQGAGL